MSIKDGGPLLKVGDVIATDARFGTNVDLCTITKVTPTMYVTDGYRFRHDLQVVAPDRFGPWSGRIPTERDWIRARIMAAKERLRKFEVTAENIAAVEAMLQDGAREAGQ